MERYAPLIGYKKAQTCDSYNMLEQRDNEGRKRHWALVWWKEGGCRHTAELLVVTEGMPDFCGGLIVYSPRVELFHENGVWSTTFCAPGQPASDSPPIQNEWKDFDTSMALDLAALTGKEEWTSEEVIEFGYKSIAAAVAGQAHAYCKRGIMGVDRIGGRMCSLWDAFGTMGEFMVSPAYKVEYGDIKDAGMKDKDVFDWMAPVLKATPELGNEWRNANSGNECHWMTSGIWPVIAPSEEGFICCDECCEQYDSDEFDVCPDCGYMDEDTIRSESFGMDKVNRQILGSATYRTRARRYYWRNG